MITLEEKVKWLNQLKADDDVVLGERSMLSIRKVTRVTAKWVFINIGDIKEYEQAFWKKNGAMVGGDAWGSKTISMPTPDVVRGIEERQELEMLRNWLNGRQFSLVQLRAMKDAFDACGAKKSIAGHES